MAEPSIEEPVPPGVQDDHTQVLALLSSADMQTRLQNARIQRAKILKARDSRLTEQSEVLESGNGVAFRTSGGALGFNENGQTSQVVTGQMSRGDASTSWKSWAKIFVIGLIPGLALGSGLMWYSLPGISVLPAANRTSGTAASQNKWEIVGSAENQTTYNNLTVDPSPQVQAILEDTILTDLPAGRPADDNGPVPNKSSAAPAAPDLDRVTINTTSTEAPPEIDQPRPLLPNTILSENQIARLTSEMPPVGHKRPTPVLDARQVPDTPPSLQIDLSVPQKLQVELERPSASASVVENLPLQITLHLSPNLTQEDRENAEALVTTAQVEVVNTSIAKFSILKSEIRFFHQSDAEFATSIAQDMRIRARDFSTYRPRPDSGTLEIWLAHDG